TPAGAPADTPAPANVLVNGNMEAFGADDGLAGWAVPDRCKPQVQAIIENGNRFLRVTNDDTAHSVFADQTVKVDPSWKAVTVSARMRATNLKTGKTAAQDARVAYIFKDASGQRIGNWPQVPRVRSDTGWVLRTSTADVPAGAKSLYIQLA